MSNILSWVGGASLPDSLMSGWSLASASWFVYCVLDIESDLENETGLWMSLITHLSYNPKSTIDQAMKVSTC